MLLFDICEFMFIQKPVLWIYITFSFGLYKRGYKDQCHTWLLMRVRIYMTVPIALLFVRVRHSIPIKINNMHCNKSQIHMKRYINHNCLISFYQIVQAFCFAQAVVSAQPNRFKSSTVARWSFSASGSFIYHNETTSNNWQKFKTKVYWSPTLKTM